MNKKELIWFGPVFSYSGYAQHNRGILLELVRRGWDIELRATENYIPEDLEGKQTLIKLLKNKISNPGKTVSISLVPPPATGYFSGYNVLYTTIESMTVHDGALRRMTMYDEVWVPCKANKISLEKAGYPTREIYRVQEGVDVNKWHPGIGKIREYESKAFTFFYCGDWSYRKGIDLMIGAFAREFLPGENVRLLLLTHYQGSDGEKGREAIKREYEEILNKNKITYNPRVEFILDFIPDSKLPEIFNVMDCYLAPTRGEAWGLPIMQALSCGKPAIVTEWGGQMDYCNKKNSWLIKVKKFDTMHDKVHLAVDFYWYQLFPFPDGEDLRKKMREAYNNPEECKKKGMMGRMECMRKWKWENAVDVVEKNIKRIYRRWGRRQ